jgi:single-stranded DNA-binding protein
VTILALASGSVSGSPVARSTGSGKPFATFSLRAQAGEGSAFVSVAVFDSEIVGTALALSEGDAVSVTGRLELRTWRGRDGEERTGLSVTATQLLRLDGAEPKKRAPKPKAAPRPAAEVDPFGPVAGDLDAVLPNPRGMQ